MMAKTNCRKRRTRLSSRMGNGVLEVTVEEGFLLNRENAMFGQCPVYFFNPQSGFCDLDNPIDCSLTGDNEQRKLDFLGRVWLE